jgi:hypothetical protein
VKGATGKEAYDDRNDLQGKSTGSTGRVTTRKERVPLKKRN